jgi:hypothetical protein
MIRARAQPVLQTLLSRAEEHSEARLSLMELSRGVAAAGTVVSIVPEEELT